MLNLPQNKYMLSKPSAIAQAAAEGTILEATAMVCNQNHDLLCDLGCMRGIIPRSAGAIGIAEGQVRDIALISRVGKPVSFVVTEIRTDAEGRPLAILSRERAQRICMREYIGKLRPGQIIDAKITHLESFGAFCDIGCGVIALLRSTRFPFPAFRTRLTGSTVGRASRRWCAHGTAPAGSR